MSVKTKMPTNPSWAMVDRGRVRFYEKRRELSQDHPKARPIQVTATDDLIIAESGNHKKRLIQHGGTPEQAVRDLNKILV